MGYVRQVLFTYLLRILMIPVGLACSVVIARWLGPADLGVFAAIGTFLMTASQLGNLGLPIAVMRWAASNPERIGGLIANARLTGAIAGLTVLGGVTVFGLAAPLALGEIPLGLLICAGLALPLNLGSSQFLAILLGSQRARQFNLMDSLNRLLLLGGAFVALVLLGLGLKALVLLTVFLAAIQYILYHILLRPASSTWRPDLGLLRGIGRLSAKAYLTVLLIFLVLRSDLLLINAMLGSAWTGIYNIAVQGADALIILPSVAAILLFPRIASKGENEGAELTAAVCRHAALIMGVACVGTAVAAWWAVKWLYGEPYQQAVPSLWLLLPGVWLFSIQNILHNDLSGRDYPLYLPATWLVTLLVNIALNLVLLPRWGIKAAAASSTIAYAISFVFIGRYWLRRFPQIGVRRLLLLEAWEVRALAGRVRLAILPGRSPERASS